MNISEFSRIKADTVSTNPKLILLIFFLCRLLYLSAQTTLYENVQLITMITDYINKCVSSIVYSSVYYNQWIVTSTHASTVLIQLIFLNSL
jgi:hypothetical protein